jgi:puromycin-sensitive aminopeptidase
VPTENPYRLSRNVVPSRYDLALTPDLANATFDGMVTITIDVAESTSVIVLNAAELVIHEAEIELADGSHLSATVELDAETERLSLRTTRPVPAGSATISLGFSGVLNDKLRGFYRSTFVDTAGVEQVIATTQMQATDCRRAFPCFDEPDFKAVFGVTLIVDSGLMAISNSAEESRMEIENKVSVRFADTMKMSSYLVAFIVGPLAATEPVDVNGTPLRVVYIPGKEHLTAFGLDCGAFGLRFFEDFYGIKYPGDKVDLVALPDFAAGAMENLGCVTFRESLLLVDPETGTQQEKETVADVVLHELAHMWFGDLVTMSWWNGIWLNEAFATFMEVDACEAYRPEWKRWTSFSLERTIAFETDSLAATRSVEFEVRSPEDADGMFDVLTYQKGGALLRMLQQYLGEDRFRDGVRTYLAKHSYANTETSDLWDAIEEATGEPVRRLMDSWIWQPGYPLVTADLDGDTLVLRQQRFGFTESAANDPAQWLIPIHVRNGGSQQKVLIEGAELRVALTDSTGPVVVNAGGYGFVRVAYDAALRARLAGPTLASLSTIERYTLVDDAWSSVVAGRLSAAGFLDLARGFGDETDMQVWQALAGALRHCSRLVDGEALVRFRSHVRALAGPALRRLGWEPTDGESDLTSNLRGLLIGLVAVLGADTEAETNARKLYEQALADPASVSPELIASATNVVAATGTVEDYDRMLATFRTAATPQEQLRNLYALADFPDEALMRRTCELALSGEVKSQNAPFLLNRCIANRTHGPLAWSVVRQNWSQVNDTFPANTIVRMIDPVKLLNRPADEADIQGFFGEHDIPQSTKTLAQILERQRINVAVRSREESDLATHLG